MTEQKAVKEKYVIWLTLLISILLAGLLFSICLAIFPPNILREFLPLTFIPINQASNKLDKLIDTFIFTIIISIPWALSFGIVFLSGLYSKVKTYGVLSEENDGLE